MKFLKENDLVFPIFLLIIWVLLCVLINPFLDVPITDDWRYAYPVKSLIETGHLAIKSEFAPNTLFQIGWGYIFCLIGGFSFTALRFSTIVLAFIGLIFLYKTIKKLNQPAYIAFLICILAMCNPIFFSLSNSFMTDVPFLSLCIITINLYQSFFETEKIRFLIWGTLVSIAAFLVRQPAIVFPIMMAIILVLFKKRKSNYWKLALGLLITTTIVYIATEWFKGYMGIKWVYVSVNSQFMEVVLSDPLFFVSEIIKKIVKAIITIGLFSIPLLPLIKNLTNYNKRWHIVIILLNLVLLYSMIQNGKIFPFAGTSLINFGIGPTLVKDIYILELPHTPVLPKIVFIFINFVGQIAGSYLLIAMFRYVRSNITPFHILLIATSTIYLLMMSITSFYDRYYLLPAFAVILLAAGIVEKEYFKGVRKFISILIFLPLAWFSITGTADYMAWRKVQLGAFNWAISKGITIKEMDAGMELNGWYNYKLDYHPANDNSWWWVDDDKFIITMGYLKGYSEIARFPYSRYLDFRKGWIFVLKRNDISKETFMKKQTH